MSAYDPPIQDLAIFDPSAFTSNDEPLTITTGSKYFLKFPIAQGTEYFNTLSANEITSSVDLLLNPVGSVEIDAKLNMKGNEIDKCDLIVSENNTDIVIEGKGTGDVVFKTNNIDRVDITDTGVIDVLSNPIENCSALRSTNNQNITIEGKGTGDVILRTSNTDRMTFTDTGDINTANRIIMNSATSANRTINSSLLGLNENIGAYNSTLLGQIYQSGTVQYHQNLATNSTINFVVKDSGSNNITPLQLTPTDNIIPSNVNLTMGAGSGRISQSIIVGSTSSSNLMKKTTVRYHSNSVVGSPEATIDTYDEYNGRGLFIIPNSGQGSYASSNQLGDSCIISRALNSGTVTISNYANDSRNCIRVGYTDVSNCFVRLENGRPGNFTAFYMDYNKNNDLTTTTFNNVINFNPNGNLIATRRQLTGLGTLNFTDISGNTTTGVRNSLIYMETSASVPGMFYDCSLNNGSHNFVVNDNTGNKKTPVFFGANITSVLNTFSVRNDSITSNRFDILTDATQNTNIRARSSTNSTTASININCDSVSAGGAVTNSAVLSIEPTFLQLVRPLRLIYQTFPSAMTEIGFSVTGSANANIPIGGVASSASIRNQGTYSLTTSGTYLINWGISAEMNSGTATFTGGGLQFGISTTATNSFDTNTQTYTSYVNLTRLYPTLTTATIYQPTSCIFRTTSSSTTIYFNYLAEYTSGTNIIPGGQYTICRIG